MSRFDEEPDGDPHGECAAEIARLNAELREAHNCIVRLNADIDRLKAQLNAVW